MSVIQLSMQAVSVMPKDLNSLLTEQSQMRRLGAVRAQQHAIRVLPGGGR